MAKKTALVTGCSEGGIGAELARAFAKKGCHVFAAVRNPAKAATVASDDIEIVTMDVTSQDSVTRCAALVKEKTGGRLDALVNNAGIVWAMPLLDVDIEESKKLYDTNVWGIMRVIQAFMPFVIETKGTVLNISSAGAYFWQAWQGVYNSSKAAVSMISETLRLEVEPFGVKVQTGIIGFVSTRIFDNASKFELPSDSLYHEAAPVIKRLGAEGPEAKWEPANITAANLVSDVMSQKSGFVHRGTLGWTGHYGPSYLPTKLMDTQVNKGRGVDLITRRT